MEDQISPARTTTAGSATAPSCCCWRWTGPTEDAQAGPPRILAIARHPAPPACPARALEDWMRASETRFGPLFRKVDRWGNVEHHRLGADAIRRILLSRGRHAKGMVRRPAA